MNAQNLQEDIQKKVFERIEGGASMHPRIYFIARAAAVAVVALAALLLSAFVLSFIVFSIHESGEQFLLGFGSRGILTFFALFPWFSLVADIVLLVLLEWLLQGFKFAYRFSLLTLFAGVFMVSAGMAFLVVISPIHPSLLNRADSGRLPVVGDIYENIRDSHASAGVYRGTVVFIRENNILISHNDRDHDPDDGTWKVTLPKYPAGLSVGDRVYVFGTSTGQGIEAYGFEKLAPDQ